MKFKYKIGDKVIARIDQIGAKHIGIINHISASDKNYPYTVSYLDVDDYEVYREDELSLIEDPNDILNKICD